MKVVNPLEIARSIAVSNACLTVCSSCRSFPGLCPVKQHRFILFSASVMHITCPMDFFFSQTLMETSNMITFLRQDITFVSSMEITQESLEECFVAAFNSVLARKEEIIANYAECLDAITDDSVLQARMEAIQLETTDLTTLINNLLMNSSKQRGGGEDTNKRYEEYMSRHEALQQEKLELSKQISLLAAKRLLVNSFLEELKKHNGPLTAFDPLVFQATVNYVTVSKDCTVTFLFRDGTEATETIQKGVKPYVRRKAKPDGDISTDTDGGEST